MTRDIPIIFSAPMVRALIAGRKTMTRRLAMRPARKGERSGEGSRLGYVLDANGVTGTITTHERPSPWQKVKAGDRLWVRESLKHVTSDPVTAEDCSLHCYMASIPPGMDSANPYEPNYLFPEDGTPSIKPKSTPSIHMPRWASRLTLIVTAAKTEPLQDISEADARAEGWAQRPEISDDPEVHRDAARDWFSDLWGSLHGVESWKANPIVVALTFRAIAANIDSKEAQL